MTVRPFIATGSLALAVACGRSVRVDDAGAAGAAGHGGNSGGAAGTAPNGAGTSGTMGIAGDTCATAEMTLGAPARAIELVVPVTEKMFELVPEDPRTRYQAISDSIAVFLELLDPQTHWVGLTLHPGGAGCGTGVVVPKPIDVEQREAIERALASAGPSSWASVEAGVDQGVHHLDGVVAHDKIIVLFPDESPAVAPNCETDLFPLEPLLETVDAAADRGILIQPVAVPGGGGTSDYQRAFRQQSIGGCFGDCIPDFSKTPDFGEELYAFLPPLRTIDVSCSIPLPTESDPLDLSRVTLTITLDEGAPLSIPRQSECGDQDGFTIRDETTLELCPASCALVTGASAGKIFVTIACGEWAG